MGLGSSLTIMVIGLLVLAYSSSRLVKLMVALSSILKMPKFLLSFVILGLGTSLPDLFVSAFAASQLQFDMVIATIIGANIIVMCLVVGVVTIRKGFFAVRENTILENFGWIFFVLAIPFFLMLDNKLTSMEGFILIVVYAMYLYNIKEQEPVAKKEEDETRQVSVAQGLREHDLGRTVLMLVLFVGVVVVAANFVVGSALTFSTDFKVNPMLIGFIILSLGMALPEFAVDLNALRNREEEVIWGDVIGSFITELTLVLGLAAVVSGGMAFQFQNFIVAYGFMVLAFLLVFFFAYRKKQLSRNEGIMLVLLYVIFISVQVDLVHSLSNGAPGVLTALASAK
ncbi:MAG: hypothetical protein V1708_06280 [Candidatus Micrarchaeota archaeon]